MNEPVATYDYGLAIKGRFEEEGEKTFRWRMAESDKWDGLKGVKESELPLYGSSDGPTVFVVEGEKAVDACLVSGIDAVCAAGGASAKDFGSALAQLDGKRVILWPDNDDVGRGLMRRMGSAINGTAEVSWVLPEVPDKGDAFDYFTAGGTVDHLLMLAAASSLHPRVEELDDGYMVTIPDLGGGVYFEFRDVSERAHDLSADVTVWQDVPGQSRDRFSTRLNVLSASARDGWRRSLDEMFSGAKGYWTGLVNKAVTLMRTAHQERDWSVDLHGVETNLTVEYLVHPILPAEGATIWFGMGESGKSYVVLSTLLAMALESRPVMFVDYEADERAIKRRVVRLAAGMGTDIEESFFRRWFIYWPARGKPFPSMLPAIKRRCEVDGITVIGIDSAAAACGSNPNDEEAALGFFNSLSKLRIPSLIVAHVTKDDKDRHPFGSVFWHNYARATWNVKTPEERVDGEKHLGFYPRKNNEDAPHKPLGMVLEFGEGTTVVKRSTLEGELSEHLSAAVRIRKYLLKVGKASRKTIAEDLGLRDETVRKALQRMPDAMVDGNARSPDALWMIIGD